jgi:hypothetical protein
MCSYLKWVLNVKSEELSEFEAEVKHDYGVGGAKAPAPISTSPVRSATTTPIPFVAPARVAPIVVRAAAMTAPAYSPDSTDSSPLPPHTQMDLRPPPPNQELLHRTSPQDLLPPVSPHRSARRPRFPCPSNPPWHNPCTSRLPRGASQSRMEANDRTDLFPSPLNLPLLRQRPPICISMHRSGLSSLGCYICRFSSSSPALPFVACLLLSFVTLLFL